MDKSMDSVDLILPVMKILNHVYDGFAKAQNQGIQKSQGKFVMTMNFDLPQDYSTVNKEVIFYSNARTGEIIENWTTPWTGEEVNVVQVANDPFNYTISDFLILFMQDFERWVLVG